MFLKFDRIVGAVFAGLQVWNQLHRHCAARRNRVPDDTQGIFACITFCDVQTRMLLPED